MRSINVMPAMREWYERHIAEPRRHEQENRAAAARVTAKAPKVRTPATADELAAIAAIAPGCVTYLPGIGTKRFARQIQGVTELTDGQRKYLWQVVWRFRRQIADPRLVRIAKAKCAEVRA